MNTTVINSNLQPYPPETLVHILSAPPAQPRLGAQAPVTPLGAVNEQALKGIGAEQAYNARFPHLNTKFYEQVTIALLDKLYPKTCPHCNTIMNKPVKGRPKSVRCPKCNYMTSRVSYTPLHMLKLELFMFSYLLHQAIILYPQVLSTSAIHRLIGGSVNTATLMKRRIQLFLIQFEPAVKRIINEELDKHYGKDFRFPTDVNADLSQIIAGKPILTADTAVVYSHSMRSNGWRKKYGRGLTASIYLDDKVALERGKYQIGTLVNTIILKGGGVVLDSIPDLQLKTVQPLFNFLSNPNTPLFTDEGYRFMQTNLNHRMINHSAKSKDKRYRFSRERWCKGGVNNQASEGFQRGMKHNFIGGYTFFNCKFSILYVKEYATLKSIRAYGLPRLIDALEREKREAGAVCDNHTSVIRDTNNTPVKRNDKYLQEQIKMFLYTPPTPEQRKHLNLSVTRKQIKPEFKKMFEQNEFFYLREAHYDYLLNYDDMPKHRRAKDDKYNSVAVQLFNSLSRIEAIEIKPLSKTLSISYDELLRIVKTWSKLNVAEISETKNWNGSVTYSAKLKIEHLPPVFYTYDRSEFENQPNIHENVNSTKQASSGYNGKYGITKEQRKKLINKEK